MATLTYVPSYALEISHEPRVLVSKFGEGYEQRLADGINSQLKRYAVTFDTRDNVEADGIEAFFVAQGAVAAFDWTPPRGIAAKFVCRRWKKVLLNAANNVVQAEFDEVPA